MKPHRRNLTLIAAAAAAIVLPPLAPAHAASDGTVQIPLHPVPAELRLIGASEVGAAVQSEATPGGVKPVFTGPLGGELVRRPVVDPSVSYYTYKMLTVVGNTLAWHTTMSGPGRTTAEAHRLNILTGEDRPEAGSIAAPNSFNGESWFSHEQLSTIELNGDSPLRRYRAGTDEAGRMKLELLAPNVSGVVGRAMASDQTSVLRATHDVSNERYALDLYPLRKGEPQRVTEGEAEIVGVALSDALLVWATRAEDGFLIHQKPRGGGPVLTYAEPDPHADVAHLVAGKAGVAYLRNNEKTGVVIVNGSTAHRRDLLYRANGLAAVGDHFLTASVGHAGSQPSYSADQGVYKITKDEFTKVAGVPAAHLTPQQLTLSAGRLRYSHEDNPGHAVYERIVTGTRPPRFSEETRIGTNTSLLMAFSAGRGIVGVPGQPGVWQLLDRGRETEKVEAPEALPNVSGPYTLIGGKVFRPDGEHIYTEPNPRGADDIFGSQIVYAMKDVGGTSTIWVDDVERRVPRALTTVDAGCDGGAPSVSIWGELVAWSTSCGDRVDVLNLRTGATRKVATDAGPVWISLSEGTLTWRDAKNATSVVDLTTAVLASVTLPGESWLPASVDDHWVARRVNDAPWATARAELTPLPFDRKLKPRLIATLSPLGFSPDGDGQGDVWAPEFDITKPMRSVTLKIQNQAGTSTIATLEGEAEDGSVRGLRWNGLSSKGKRMPAGTYRWTLSGRSADRDGTLIGPDGSAAVSGTIELEVL